MTDDNTFLSQLNIKDTDLDILEKNLTSDKMKNEEYDNLVTADYQTGKMLAISAAEYKNMILAEYFINELFKHQVSLWSPFEECKDLAIKQYSMTLNIADRVVNKTAKKGKIETPEKKLFIPESQLETEHSSIIGA